MIKEEFYNLVKQYANDTLFLSFMKFDHPAYAELVSAGPDIIPFILERIKDSIGRDSGDAMDKDNCPWMLFSLLDELTNGDCSKGLPEEFAGNLAKLRSHILQWGENKNAK